MRISVISIYAAISKTIEQMRGYEAVVDFMISHHPEGVVEELQESPYPAEKQEEDVEKNFHGAGVVLNENQNPSVKRIDQREQDDGGQL